MPVSGFGGPHRCRVPADRIRLRQVVINLLSNVVKYNRECGTAGIACQEHEDRVRISATDSGQGIPAEEHPLLFRPFERVAADNRVERTGTGLAATKRWVEMIGGAIGVRSTPGHGSSFWFELDTEPGTV